MDPLLPNRHSIRLRGYDYRNGGVYFVTICTANKEHVFGNIQNGIMRLNMWGCVVADCWQQIPDHFPGTALDEFIIMPNHMHGLIYMDDPIDRSIMPANIERTGMAPPNIDRTGVACYAPAPPKMGHAPTLTGPPSGSLGSIIRSFKSATTKRINLLRNEPGAPLWQRNYYEHISRSAEDTARIRHYILQNPSRWTGCDDER